MNKILLEVFGLTYSGSLSGAYALILRNKEEKKHLPIIIGEAEAQSIAIALEGHKNRRPMTHDLFKTFAGTFDIDITEVVISRFKEGLFYSELHCMKDGEAFVIDTRPSDAIAIAVRFKCPIYANPQVMEEAGIIMDEDEHTDTGDKADIDNDIFEDGDFSRFSTDDLKIFMEEAIEREDYQMATILRDEINRRKEMI
ncbi:MAG: bifunctional nuclease family protein [Bacteroidales bacterium]|nr:bifunctional nuclease family protein [Bacteroidales bacterium]